MGTILGAVQIREQFGAHLIGRDVGKRIREQYFSGPPATWPPALDFTGVEQMTESCADELFGTLARQVDLRAVRSVELRGCVSAVREAVKYVLALVEEPPPAPSRAVIERLLGRSGRKSGAAR